MRHVIAVALLLAGARNVIRRNTTRTTWKDYLGGSDSSHYSALKQINKSNVKQARGRMDLRRGRRARAIPFLRSSSITSLISPPSKARWWLSTRPPGKELWVHSFEVAGGAGAAGGRGGGISGQTRARTIGKAKIDRTGAFSSPRAGSVHAIDARTGKIVDSFADHGKLDLKIGLDRDMRGLGSRTPGRIFENILILGSATGEGYLAPPGDIRAFDVVTGKLLWVFHTIPRPGEFGYDTWPKDAYKYMGGVDVWGEFTVDEKRGIVYLRHRFREI